MNERNLEKLVIVGAARQGLALAKYVADRDIKVTITDRRNDEEMQTVRKEMKSKQITWVLGDHPLELLDTAQALAISGGVPLSIPFIQEAVERGIPLTNDSQLFMERVSCPVIGITGSAGKTTTTLLVGNIARKAFGEGHTWVGGNIGNPLISVVDHIKPDDIAIVELSSFQLELMTSAPHIACVLNLTPNHLDRHGTMEAYSRAKSRILRYQTSSNVAVLNRDDPGSWRLRDQIQGRLISFGLNKPEPGLAGTFLKGKQIDYWDGTISKSLFLKDDIQLRGEHNLMNALAAGAIAVAAGIREESIQAGIRSLTEVEHRLEFIREYKGAEWYNDSIATAPERSIAALQSFSSPIVLLAGGKDKDLPWDEFARQVIERVRYLVLFGDAADLIEKSILEEAANRELISYSKFDCLKEAVIQTAEIVQPGDVVLLSPGGTSFDEFIDFAERGEYFKQWVLDLP